MEKKLDEEGLYGLTEDELQDKLDEIQQEIEQLKSERQKKQEENFNWNSNGERQTMDNEMHFLNKLKNLELQLESNNKENFPLISL